MKSAITIFYIAVFHSIGIFIYSNELGNIMTCKHEVQHHTNLWGPLYLINNTIPVPTQILIMNIESMGKNSFCTINVLDFVKITGKPKGMETIYFIFSCKQEQTVIFTHMANAKLHLNHFSIVGYLEIKHCGVVPNQIRSLMEITRISGALFQNVKYKTNFNLLPEFDNQSTDCTGIYYLRSIAVDNVTSSREFLRDIYMCNTSFPSVTEISLSNLSMSRLPDEIETLYPNLQSIEVQGNNIYNVPELHLSQHKMLLPYNLYRSDEGQAHYHDYTDAFHIVIERNMFRRIINLSKNKISSILPYAFKGSVHIIDINDNQISSVNETAFSLVVDLQVLNIANNRINGIPELLLANQTGLRFIDLSNNCIEYLFPYTFVFVRKLHFIDLSKNFIRALPDSLFELNANLNVLRMDFNDIEEIPETILSTSNSPLHELSLMNNRISKLPKLIFYSRHLRQIQLNNNRISWSDLSSISRTIETFKFKIEVDLSASNIGRGKLVSGLRILDLSKILNRCQ